MAEKPTVIIYADPLLAPSMTFVRAQAMALKTFDPFFVGARKLTHGGLELPKDRVVVISSDGTLGKLREIPFKVFGFDPVFCRRVSRFRPVLLHAHFGPAALTALPLARWLKIPLIASIHGFDVTVKKCFAERSNYTFRKYVRHGDILKDQSHLLIAVSRFIRQKMLEQGFPEEKIVVHYIGVDTAFFNPDPQVPRDPIVLFAARLAENKGCAYLLRAMAAIQARRPEVELVVVGDGPVRADLERQAQQILKRFRFLGFQPHEVVKQWMNRARVFSVPSVEDESGSSEGFGLVFAEAQAMGLPVVSFETGGIPEAVSNGVTGLLAKGRDWEGLSLQIERLVLDNSLWQRLSRAGRERVCALFDLKRQTAVLEDLYKQVVEESCCGRRAEVMQAC